MGTVVFVCFTPYQLMNAIYYCIHLKDESHRILIWHNYTKYMINIKRFESAFDEIIEIGNFYEESLLLRQYHKCLYGGWLFCWSKIYRLLSRLDMNKVVLFLFSDQHILSRKVLTSIGTCTKDNVLVEEGMATYLIRTRKIPKTRDWLINLVLGARYEPYIGANPLIRTLFVKHPEILPYDKKRNRTIIRQNNVFQDNMIWNTYFGDILDNISPFSKNKKTILWLGQPIEMDGVSTATQIEWLKKVASIIPDNYQILIKVHPREKENKYADLSIFDNVLVIQLKEYSWIPVEVLSTVIQPEIVLTAYSTAANNILESGITCKIIYCYHALGLHIGKEADQYINSDENIYCIKQHDELLQILDKPILASKTTLKNTDSDLSYIRIALRTSPNEIIDNI